MSRLAKLGFKYFLPEINFQNLYSVLAIILFNFLSLKILLPIKDIFFIFALSPRLKIKLIFTRLLLSFSTVVSIFEL